MLKAHTGSNVYSEELDNWDTAYWPRYSAYQTNESSVNRVLTTPNDRYMQDVSYIRLKNLTVDYTFPAHICQMCIRDSFQPLRPDVPAGDAAFLDKR